MPIYEYRCPNGHTFEVFQRFADAPIEVCQECGAAPVEKILFPVAVHFKGSGFYATDYGRGGRKPGKDDSGASADGGSSSDAKPEKAATGEKTSGSGSADKGKSTGGDKKTGGSD
ncbi:MAG: zinc ribbon domain-containing protein [Chloroflexota bacterium]|nr:MAG: zinc ribbon domain-containing protein [Chloroflexota bacterium]